MIGFVVQVAIDHGLEIADLSLGRLGEDGRLGLRLPVGGVVLELREPLGELVARGQPREFLELRLQPRPVLPLEPRLHSRL